MQLPRTAGIILAGLGKQSSIHGLHNSMLCTQHIYWKLSYIFLINTDVIIQYIQLVQKIALLKGKYFQKENVVTKQLSKRVLMETSYQHTTRYIYVSLIHLAWCPISWIINIKLNLRCRDAISWMSITCSNVAHLGIPNSNCFSLKHCP